MDNHEYWRRMIHPPVEHYDIRRTAGFAVTVAYRALRGHLAVDRLELGVHEGQDLVLLEIGRLQGRGTAAEVRTTLGLSAGGISGVLGHLEAWGYIRRTRDPRDGRVRRLELTDRGRRSAVPLGYVWRETDRVLLRRGLTDADLLWLARLGHRAGEVWSAPPAEDEEDGEDPLRPPPETV